MLSALRPTSGHERLVNAPGVVSVNYFYRPDASSASFSTMATDLRAVWNAPTADARLKKRIVKTVIREVLADIDEDTAEIVLAVHWAGGVHTDRYGLPSAVASGLARTRG